MKNKGFTLIELIGTLVILSLLLIIIAPLVTRSLRNGIKKADEQAKANIELAAKNWKSDNKGDSREKITIEELINNGYLDDEVKLPSTSETISSACVKITLKTESPRKTYKYEYKDLCS